MAALSEEQSIIRDQAKAWAVEQAPVQAFRAVRDAHLPGAFEPKTWAAMAELGWTGIVIPEAYGGSDLGYLTFGLVLEELGRNLTAAPLFASALVGASALLLGGNEAQKRALLPEIAKGQAIVTLAVDEGPRHAPAATAMTAVAEAGGFRLDGEKTFVLEGMAATHLIVAARTAGRPGETAGITLFLVPADAAGIRRAPIGTMDSRGYATIRFDGVAVPADAVLGAVDGGFPLLDATMDRARAGLAAEMLGTAAAAFDLTLDYLKTRKQFGRVIGSFQALGHRAAALFSSLELARSCVEAALQALDDGAPDAAQLCSLAKARMGECLYDMSNDLIQIHGGIGMTDEFDAGLYLKRARVLEAAFGNRAFHRDRYARLLGY
ncbi:MAG: acyl-CoA dehydrogenase family protein [Alphaproteobacteria bacterium]|nr:acyl-CoA dehydrogenase family protein [Alphaproteobacteria bacterium]